MPNTDGSIVIGVDLSLTQAEKQLKKFEGKVEEAEQKINDLTAKRDKASQDGVFQKGVLDEEKAKLEEIKEKLKEAQTLSKDKTLSTEKREFYSYQATETQAELEVQKEKVREIQSEWNVTQASVKKYANQIQNANMELDQNKAKAGQLADSINQANKQAERFKRHLQDSGKDVDKLGKRLKGLLTRVMVFSVFTMALRSMRTWMSNVIKTNSQATQAMAKLKGALLTLVQPLVNVLIPAFITLVEVLTSVVTVAAKVVSSLFGTTVEQSAKAAEKLKEEQDALNGVGKAAKTAGKQMASFDEINKLQDTTDTDGSGASSTEIAPDFSFMDSMSEHLKEKLDEISKIVFFIGTGFALWKIGSTLPGALGGILTTLGLVLVAIGGIALAWDGLTDAWENGVDWINMAEIIGGVAIAAGALYTAFGNIAAGVELVVGGIAMIVGGFHDAMENGWNLNNTLLAMAGLFATGLGISLLIGGPIPALIGAIAAILLAITVATGHGGELLEGLGMVFEGLAGFFTNLIHGDFAAAFASLATAFEGVGMIFGAVLSGVEDMFLNFLDWLDEKTGGKFHDIIETVKITVEWLFESAKEVLNGIIDFIAGVFTGDWDRVWKGIVEILDGLLGLMATPFVGIINLIIDGLNALIRGLNKINFDVPDWVPVIGGKSFGFDINPIQKLEFPKLAQGAVIPPNREFMAVLGDQKNGTNIEAPLATMVQAFKQAAMEVGMGGNGKSITVVMELDRRELGRAVYTLNNEESQRVGVRLAGVRT